MTNPSELRQAAVGDIHLGHPKTTTEHIIESLDAAFPDTEETGRLDIIWFEGDLFDRQMHYNDPNVGHIQSWFIRFLRMCKRRDIVVRLLEGTPSHDWRQLAQLMSLHAVQEIDADVRYVNKLEIEYIERFGIHVLYIPDEWKPDPDDIWKDVQETLRQHQLEQVDYIVMHGAFKYQLPPAAVDAPTHIPERYLSITKKYIFIGHIHLMSKYDRILAAGSVDRLQQGEEGAKGHWRVTARRDGNDEIVFHENKNAKIYKTIDCVGLTLDESLERISNFVNFPPGSFFRITAHKGDAIFAGVDIVKARYPEHRWSVEAAKTDADVQKRLLVDLRKTNTQIHIGSTNILSLAMTRIATMTQDPQVLAQCERSLQEIA